MNVNYMVVNHQGMQAQRLHEMLNKRLSSSISLHKQEEHQPDVWQALSGDKDDFLIYDRCGRLTDHISLPYSIIGQGHIENAIKQSYCKRPCGDCMHEPSGDLPAVCNGPVESRPEGEGPAAVEVETEPGRGHGHGHHHGEQHVAGHTHGQGHGHHHGDHHGAGHAHGQNQHGHSEHRQGHDQGVRVEDLGLDISPLDLGQLLMGQQAMHLGQMPQGPQVALERP